MYQVQIHLEGQTKNFTRESHNGFPPHENEWLLLSTHLYSHYSPKNTEMFFYVETAPFRQHELQELSQDVKLEATRFPDRIWLDMSISGHSLQK